MKKKIQKYLLLILASFLAGCSGPPVNWSPTFDSAHTIPYGTYVLHQEMETLFPGSQRNDISYNTYEFLEQMHYESRTDTYMLIYPNDLFTDGTWEKLLQYVNQGGTAFISGAPNATLSNALGFEYGFFGQNHLDDEIIAGFSVRNSQHETTYNYQEPVTAKYFAAFDPEITEVLGYIHFEGKKEPNFMKIYHGNGFFLLHSEPYVFTNYHLLRSPNEQYVAEVLSYLPDANILWDNHRINQRENRENDGGFFNALGFILKHKSLRWAFFILLAMGSLFLLFNSKRKQKAVRIIEPYPNYSLSFARTLSELYKNHSNHTALVKYKINYFLDQIRVHYHISAKDTQNDFAELLSTKSGVDIKLCKKLALQIDIFRTKDYLDKEDFFKLESLIHSFKLKSGHYGRTAGRK